MVFVGGFFILSGFFTHISGLKNFWSKRFWKTYVPYLIAISIIFVVVYFCNNHWNLSLSDYAASILVFPTLISKWQLVDGALWYVGKLLIAYFLVSISFLIGRLFRNEFVAFICNFVWNVFCFASCFIDSQSFFSKMFLVIFDSRLCLFFLGFFLASFMEHKERRIRNKDIDFSSTFVFIFSLVLSFIFFGVSYSRYNVFYFSLVVSLIYFSLLEKNNFFDKGVFHLFGKSSYWCYLMHQFVGYLIIYVFDGLGLYFIGLCLALFYAAISGLTLTFLWNKVTDFLSLYRGRTINENNE